MIFNIIPFIYSFNLCIVGSKSGLVNNPVQNFYDNSNDKLKEDYIDKGLVKFEHHAFPLDLAALNAEVVVRCQTDINKKFKLLEKIYEKQKSWAIGSDINKINKLITSLLDRLIEKIN